MPDESEAEATEPESTEPEADAAATDVSGDGSEEAVAADAEPADEGAEAAEAAADDTDVKTAVADEEPADDEAPAETTDVAASVTVKAAVTPVGNGRRFGAFLLDGVLFVVTLGIGWIIWSLARTWAKGQSPGKSLLGLQVVKPDTGETAAWGTMFVREVVGKGILGLIPFYTLVSAVLILVNDSREGLWDKVAKTVVVEKPDS
jgi:uncharacterized RDD family membrane protein YckC